MSKPAHRPKACSPREFDRKRNRGTYRGSITLDPPSNRSDCVTLINPIASVLIVGAGPTGLVLALSLSRLGVNVRIIDKNQEAGTTSRALGVHARTLEFYRQLGISEPVIANGIKTAGVNLWVRGSRAARLPLDEMGKGQSAFPFVLMYPQDVHERFLAQELAFSGINTSSAQTRTGLDLSSNRSGCLRSCGAPTDRRKRLKRRFWRAATEPLPR